MLFTIIGLTVIVFIIYWLVKENQKCRDEKKNQLIDIVTVVNKKNENENKKKETEKRPTDTLINVDKFSVVGSCSRNSCSL
jgi:hypothetical protein